MIKRSKLRLFGAAATLAIFLAANPSMAQVPVTDAQVTANTQQILQKVTQHLTLLQQIQQLTQQIKAATGNAGAGANGIQKLLSGSGLSSGSSLLTSLTGMAQGIIASTSQNSSTAGTTTNPAVSSLTNNTSAPFTAALGTLSSIMNGQVTGSNAIQQLNSMLYINSSTAPTAQQVEAVNDIRRLNLQNAAITALSTALQVQNSVGNNGSSQFSSLTQGASQTGDLRSDIAANTTAMLKMLEQTVAQNGLLAASLNLQAAWNIAQDGINGRAGGNQNGTGSTGTSTNSTGTPATTGTTNTSTTTTQTGTATTAQ